MGIGLIFLKVIRRKMYCVRLGIITGRELVVFALLLSYENLI